MITLSQKGNFHKATNFLERAKEIFRIGILNKYGEKGVQALSKATPVLTGRVASSWYYTIEHQGKNSATIVWSNSDIEGGYNVALLLQYGHGVKGGGYVQGIDYISPAIVPIIEELASEIIEEVEKL